MSDDAAEQVLTYAIPGNDNGGRIFVYGNKDAEFVLFFCGGFPDDCVAFQPFAKRLAAEKNILCGVTCQPGYDCTAQSNFKPTGYTFDEMVDAKREACKILKERVSTNPKATLTGVFHDWGSITGAMLVNRMNTESPNYFRDVVYFDVLPPAARKLQIAPAKNLKKAVVFFAYTSLFASCHAVQRYVSHYLAAPMLGLGFGTLALLGLTPTGKVDSASFRAREPRLAPRKLIYMQYPYFNLYKGLFLGRKSSGAGMHLPLNVQEMPVLYMYGLSKNIQFHDANVVEWLKSEGAKAGKTKVVPVENAGHWLYVQQEDICYEAVKKFVSGK